MKPERDESSFCAMRPTHRSSVGFFRGFNRNVILFTACVERDLAMQIRAIEFYRRVCRRKRSNTACDGCP